MPPGRSAATFHRTVARRWSFRLKIMQNASARLPDRRTLTAYLAHALTEDGRAGQSMTIIERRLPRLMCTFPNEIIVCRWSDGDEQTVFIKYESNHQHSSFGHRGNVSYEATIYRRLLRVRPD